ncbi:MAG: ATP-binding protein [Methylacidiphilales bacterium]|nr:ATP-binding protein [Candidatus Methylacidiphilales bacterium]
MLATKTELLAILRQYNPWWQDTRLVDLPKWKRAAFHQMLNWIKNPPAHRALLLSGARQIGKTTLLLQAIEALIESGVPPAKILYATFDHPLLKLAGLDGLLDLWRELEPERNGTEYLFLDEIQYTKDWQTWLKHQVDFFKKRQIIVTGSATPLAAEGQESGVGRWHTLRLATLSFYEYLQIKQIAVPELPVVQSLQSLFTWSPRHFSEVSAQARPLVADFHEYLLRGGFPQSAQVESIAQAQKLLREDIVDKVLKRDMTALFGVRRVLELEQTFLYLCLHDGGLLDIPDLCKNLQVKKPTANNFIALLESTHLIHRLPPFGYGKEILRARYKLYLADAAIAPSVMLKGKSLLEDPAALGVAVETAFFKHVYTRYYDRSIGFSYWRGKKDHEVDIIASVEQRLVPFEIKYRAQDTGAGDLKGMQEFCAAKGVEQGYVITKQITDFSVMPLPKTGVPTHILKIPAPLACYWLGRSEVEGG